MEDRLRSLKCASDNTPVQGGGAYDDRMINIIVEKERLKYTYNANRLRVRIVENGLAALNDVERTVVTEFAKNKPGTAVDRIAERTNYERAQIYRIYDAALYKFTVAEYGITEF